MSKLDTTGVSMTYTTDFVQQMDSEKFDFIFCGQVLQNLTKEPEKVRTRGRVFVFVWGAQC